MSIPFTVDRYMAVVDRPLLYEERVTHFRVGLAIIGCWILSALTGFLPVFTGIYSSPEHLESLMKNSAMTCDLVVNKYFSVIAGCISFWLPGMFYWVHWVRIGNSITPRLRVCEHRKIFFACNINLTSGILVPTRFSREIRRLACLY